jgi:hypothetical protein
MTPYRIVWKCKEFEICIPAASSAPRHAAVLDSVHNGPSQNHYLLNIMKLFPLNQTRSARKLYDHMILERQFLLNIIFIYMTFSYLVYVNR